MLKGTQPRSAIPGSDCIPLPGQYRLVQCWLEPGFDNFLHPDDQQIDRQLKRGQRPASDLVPPLPSRWLTACTRPVQPRPPDQQTLRPAVCLRYPGEF
jgi:hypothetical protein